MTEKKMIRERESASDLQPSSRLRVLGIVLAGGKGTRLHPLTRERAKPAVPFGGKYRIIDFVLSNFVNSGINSIYVLTQFRSQSLLQHLSEGWQYGGLLKNHFITNVPAQMRSEKESWYQGTADAIFQNINLIEQSDPHLVAIFGGDHVYCSAPPGCRVRSGGGQ
jgi:glucose-1-phosphate adenylyltransferase